MGTLILVVLFLLFAYPAAGWKIRTLVAPGTPAGRDANRALTFENESLKAELAKVRIVAKYIPSYSGTMIPAFVYSRYPFNLKNELLVTAGSDRGVQTGQAAVTASDASSSALMFAGKVENVYSDTSLVETIFDVRFQVPVRIGDSGASALLKGGNNPKLALIPKTAKIAEGAIVYSADAGGPYGLPIGTLKNLRLAQDQLFQEADVEVPYNAGDLQTVFILSEHHAAQ